MCKGMSVFKIIEVTVAVNSQFRHVNFRYRLASFFTIIGDFVQMLLGRREKQSLKLGTLFWDHHRLT